MSVAGLPAFVESADVAPCFNRALIAAPDREKARELVRRALGGCARDRMEDADIVVVIGGDRWARAAHVERALRARKHVIVDAPVGDAETLERLLWIAGQRGLLIDAAPDVAESAILRSETIRPVLEASLPWLAVKEAKETRGGGDTEEEEEDGEAPHQQRGPVVHAVGVAGLGLWSPEESLRRAACRAVSAAEQLWKHVRGGPPRRFRRKGEENGGGGGAINNASSEEDDDKTLMLRLFPKRRIAEVIIVPRTETAASAARRFRWPPAPPPSFSEGREGGARVDVREWRGPAAARRLPSPPRTSTIHGSQRKQKRGGPRRERGSDLLSFFVRPHTETAWRRRHRNLSETVRGRRLELAVQSAERAPLGGHARGIAEVFASDQTALHRALDEKLRPVVLPPSPPPLAFSPDDERRPTAAERNAGEEKAANESEVPTALTGSTMSWDLDLEDELWAERMQKMTPEQSARFHAVAKRFDRGTASMWEVLRADERMRGCLGAAATRASAARAAAPDEPAFQCLAAILPVGHALWSVFDAAPRWAVEGPSCPLPPSSSSSHGTMSVSSFPSSLLQRQGWADRPPPRQSAVPPQEHPRQQQQQQSERRGRFTLFDGPSAAAAPRMVLEEGGTGGIWRPPPPLSFPSSSLGGGRTRRQEEEAAADELDIVPWEEAWHTLLGPCHLPQPAAAPQQSRAFHHADYLAHVLRENADAHRLASAWWDVAALHDVPAWTDGEAWRDKMTDEDWLLLASVWRLRDACEFSPVVCAPRDVMSEAECRELVESFFPEPLRW